MANIAGIVALYKSLQLAPGQNLISSFYAVSRRICTEADASAFLQAVIKINPEIRAALALYPCDHLPMQRSIWRLMIAENKIGPHEIIVTDDLDLCLLAEEEGINVKNWDEKWFVAALPSEEVLFWMHKRVDLYEKVTQYPLETRNSFGWQWAINVNEYEGIFALTNLYDLGLHGLQAYVISSIWRYSHMRHDVLIAARNNKVSRQVFLMDGGALLHRLMRDKRAWRVVGAALVRYCKLTPSDFASVGAVLRY